MEMNDEATAAAEAAAVKRRRLEAWKAKREAKKIKTAEETEKEGHDDDTAARAVEGSNNNGEGAGVGQGGAQGGQQDGAGPCQFAPQAPLPEFGDEDELRSGQEDLMKQRREQQLRESTTNADLNENGNKDDEDEEDPLEAFMAAQINPELKRQKEERDKARVEALFQRINDSKIKESNKTNVENEDDDDDDEEEEV